MKKQSVIGFALIGLILILFSWYNTKQFEKQQKAKFIQDSIEAATLLKNIPADSTARIDSLAIAGAVAGDTKDSLLDTTLYKNAFLNAASVREPEFYTIENDNLKITFTTKGAQPSEVLVKKYFKYDSTALYLLKDKSSVFDIEVDAGQYINTSDFSFNRVINTDNSIVMRLYFDESSYIETEYLLASDSYTLEYNLKFVGMDDVIPRSSSQFTINWAVDIPRFEKGYDNEKNYSALGYQYTGSEDVKQLSFRKGDGQEDMAGQVSWFAFKQQFFSAIMYAPDNFSSGHLSYKVYPENDPDKLLMAANAVMNVNYGEKSAENAYPFQFYFGPNHYPTLKSFHHQYEKLIPLGGWLIGSINRYVIIPCFNWLSKYISSYGLIIFILTILIKLVISPLTLKSYLSSAKMRVIKPEVDKINARYPKKDDALKKQQATMDLYKKCGISMFGGCLPVLLQFPVLYAMFRFFPASFELRQQSFLWATDLSAYDSILNFSFKIPLYGDHISLFALLMGISMFFYSKLTMTTMDSTQMPGMKFMQLWFMPIFMVILCNNFSAGLSYYYMLSNLITIGQNWVIRKWFVNEDKLYAKLSEKANSNTAPKKSKFQQRLDEAYKVQQQQMKNNKK